MAFVYSPTDTLTYLRISAYAKSADNPKHLFSAIESLKCRRQSANGTSRDLTRTKARAGTALTRPSPSSAKPQVVPIKNHRRLEPSDTQIVRDKVASSVKKPKKRFEVKGSLRKAAILNWARRSMEGADQSDSTEEKMEIVVSPEAQHSEPEEPESPICDNVPAWPPSPVGISDYEALDREDMAENEPIYSDFNFMSPPRKESSYSYRHDLRTFPWQALMRPASPLLYLGNMKQEAEVNNAVVPNSSIQRTFGNNANGARFGQANICWLIRHEVGSPLMGSRPITPVA